MKALLLLIYVTQINVLPRHQGVGSVAEALY